MCSHEQELDLFDDDHITSIGLPVPPTFVGSIAQPASGLPRLTFDHQQSIVLPSPDLTGVDPHRETSDAVLVTATSTRVDAVAACHHDRRRGNHMPTSRI